MSAQTTSHGRRPHRGVLTAVVAVFVLAELGNGLARRNRANASYEVFRTKALHAAKARGPQRLLLAGGSNVIWGYRSALMEQELGIPTANLALEREGDEPAALRSMVLDQARSGDTVVYSTLDFWNLAGYDEKMAAQMLDAAGLDALHESTHGQLGRVVDRYWAWVPKDFTLASMLPTLFRRFVLKKPGIGSEKYNEYGDIKSCERDPQVGPDGFQAPSLDRNFPQQMRDFRDQLRQRGAELVVEIPWIYVQPQDRELWLRTYQPSLDELRSQVATITTKLSDIVFTDPTHFCNTSRHLDDAWAHRRTLAMAAFLAGRGVTAKDHGKTGPHFTVAGDVP